MEHRIHIATLADINRAAELFLKEIGNNNLWAFYGSMGAGKTTFTVALCKALGVTDDSVCSPTFTIVNEYKRKNGSPVFHFDFYRIRNNSEAMNIGLEDYLYSGEICILEWPENVEDLLPDETIRIRISVGEDLSRDLVWED